MVNSLNPVLTRFTERKQKSIYFTHHETLEAIRYAIMAELDLINTYEQLAQGLRDEQLRKVLLDIARDRYNVIGTLLAMMVRMEPIAGPRIREGVKAFEKRLGVHVEL